MKKYLILIFLIYSVVFFSQVAIGKSNITKDSNISLEFYDAPDNESGIVVPWVSTIQNTPAPYNPETGEGYRGMQGTIADGTIIFDLSDKKMKYRRSGMWFDLTGEPIFPLVLEDANMNSVTITEFNTIDSSLQDSKKEYEKAKVAIGANSENDVTNGILVLTDTNKAMILPKVASPHLNIKNPAPGMLVFDTIKKQLAVYNGTVWSFWKP